LARNGDGKALYFDFEIIFFVDVSLVCWKQSSHFIISSSASPGLTRGSKEPHVSQKSSAPMATILNFSSQQLLKSQNLVFKPTMSRNVKMQGTDEAARVFEVD
jgi:hypothetical protein